MSDSHSLTGRGQVTLENNGETVDSANPLPVAGFNSLVTSPYDYIALTYVASGNGAGEIETATYKDGGSGGTTVATITLTYDSSDRIATVAVT